MICVFEVGDGGKVDSSTVRSEFPTSGMKIKI